MTDDPFEQHRKLMLAAILNRDAARVRMLLKTPYVDPNGAAYPNGTWPWLKLAVGRLFFPVVEVLVEGGADVNIDDCPNPTNCLSAFDYAIGVKAWQIAQYFVEKNVDGSLGAPLPVAAQLYIPNQPVRPWLQLVIDGAGAPTNQRHRGGVPYTCLGMMAGNRNPNDRVEAYRYLLTKGAAANAIEPLDWRPLSLLAWFGFAGAADIAKLLIEVGGADVNYKDKFGLTALDYSRLYECIGLEVYAKLPNPQAEVVTNKRALSAYLVSRSATGIPNLENRTGGPCPWWPRREGQMMPIIDTNIPLVVTVFSRKDVYEVDGEKVWGNWSTTLDAACEPFPSKTWFSKSALISLEDAGKCALGHEVVKAEHY